MDDFGGERVISTRGYSGLKKTYKVGHKTLTKLSRAGVIRVSAGRAYYKPGQLKTAIKTLLKLRRLAKARRKMRTVDKYRCLKRKTARKQAKAKASSDHIKAQLKAIKEAKSRRNLTTKTVFTQP